jgi:hydroxysqualene synthase
MTKGLVNDCKGNGLPSTGQNHPMHRPSPAAPPITHYENFPVASLLCPAHLRAPIAAIYHFARTADDIADEGVASAQERLDALAAYRQQLVLVSQQHPVPTVGLEPRWSGLFAALGHSIHTFALPVHCLHDLLDAFTQDISKTRDGSRYADEAELRDYCRRSANPVGRLLLHLYGVRAPEALQQSDAVCTALQLINFWQDPSVDIPRGRCYFTDTALAAHGVDPADVQALRQPPAITAMLQQCVREARATMVQGMPLVHRVPGRAGWELRLVVQGGLRILDKIEALHCATLQHRPTLTPWDYGVMAWRALWM